MGGQTLKSHQPYLNEAQSEQAQLPNPETGLPAGPPASVSHKFPAGGQPGDATEAEIRLEMDAHQLQLLRADQDFQAYCRVNEWGKHTFHYTQDKSLYSQPILSVVPVARPITELGAGNRLAREDILTTQVRLHKQTC